MRVARVAVLTMLIVAATAQTAAAGQYEFRGSDGTSCTLTMTHPATPEAGGTYSVDYNARVRCTTKMGTILATTSLFAPPDRNWYPFFVEALCNGRLTCQPNFDYDIGDTATGVPAGAVMHSGYVNLILDSPTAVWVSVPLPRSVNSDFPLNCTPGQREYQCEFKEWFRAG